MSLSNTKEKSNGSKLSRLLIDGGTEVLRRTFDKKNPPATLLGAFHSHRGVLSNLRWKNVLNRSQWDKLFPPGGVAPDSNNFDITLLFILLRNICGLSPPSTGWDKLPSASDTTLEANLARIKYFRNEVNAHIISTSIEDSQLESYWKDISSALVALGLDQNEVDLLKSEPISTDYIKLLEEWTVQDQDLKEAVLNATAEIRETQHVLQEQIRLQGEKTDSAVESFHAEFREQRGSSVLSECSNLAKCKFTGLVESLCGYRFQDTRQWILEKIQHHISNEAEQVIVITARPGVGKSVIAALTCQAMKEKDKLAACHFIEHSNSLCITPKLIVESLASHLCESVDGFKENLEEQLSRNKNKELHDMNCNELFTLLVEEPLNAVSRPPETALIVTDALDEIDQSTKDEFVKALFRVTTKLPKWIKLLVTTRPMPNVIPKMPNVTVIDIEICCNNNKEDINLYLLSHLQKIYPEETRENLKTAAGTLCNMSDGIFLYAHFAVDIIEEKTPSLSQVDKLVPINVSSVYEDYLNRLIKDIPTEEDLFFRFLEALVASEGRLPKSMAFEILKFNKLFRRERRLASRSLSHLFPVDNEHVTVFHKSLIDWLSGSDEELHDFVVSKNDGHRVLAPLCFQQFDIIKSHENVPSILNECEMYALRNEFDHMFRAGGFEDQLKLCVTDLELLSLMPFAWKKLIYKGDWLIDKLKSIINHLKLYLPHEEFLANLSFYSWFADTREVFEAAINCPEESEVRKQAVHLLGTPKYHHLCVIEVFDNGWELPSESWSISEFSLSLDSKIALCIGETENGQSFLATFNTESRTLIDHRVIKERVFSCAVSSAVSHPVAAVSTDCKIKLSDPKTLRTLDVIKTESRPKVCCFLSEGAQLAVGYSDGVVRVWYISTLKLKTALTSHTHSINLCLPLPGNRLLTGDRGGTLLLWQSLGPVLQFVKVTDSFYSSNLNTVAISPDQTKIAVLCGSDYSDRVVNLFSADDGKMLMEGNLNFSLSTFITFSKFIYFIDNSRLMCMDTTRGSIEIKNAYSGEQLSSDLCLCTPELEYIYSIYRINKSELEFVAVFYEFTGKKPVVFRLHNYNVV